MVPGNSSEPSTKIEPMYSPLDPKRCEIRLLRAKKRIVDKQESLMTSMVTVSLLDPACPAYKALSYVWSDTTPMYDPDVLESLGKLSLGLGDDSTNPLASLQENALNAVWQLVDTESILTIWIDAICINQHDNAERGSQVGIMSTIYQHAEEVIAWLGPHWDAYNVGFQVIDRLAAFWDAQSKERWFQWCFNSNVPAEDRRADQYYEGPNGEKVPAWDKFLDAARESVPEWFEPDRADGRPPTHMRDLSIMGMSTLWTRAWIFQELAFSQKAQIRSGDAHTTLSNFLNAINTFHALKAAADYSAIFKSGAEADGAHWNPGEFAQTVISRSLVDRLPLWGMMSSLLRSRDSSTPAAPTPILEHRLLMSFADLNASNPRDKIFALWGFIGEGPHQHLLRPNYELTTEEVFSRAARYIVLTHRQLTILSTYSQGESTYERFLQLQFGKPRMEQKALDLPSWVPDYSSTALSNTSMYQSSMWLNELHKGEMRELSEEEFAELVKFSDDGSKLRIKGIKIGKIETVHGVDIFPYSARASRSEQVSKTQTAFRNEFTNFVQLAAHGKEIVSQYFRFVFRSAEGSKNTLFDHGTELSEPIPTMTFLENGRMLINMDGVFGSRIIKFLVRFIGEHRLFSEGDIPLREMMPPAVRSTEPLDISQMLHSSLGLDETSDIDPSKWLDSMTGAFDISSWPQSMKDNLWETARGADDDAEDREESMQQIFSWIGTKKFNFFTVPGFGLGICPAHIKPEIGDVVFRPAAYDGPIILRPTHGVEYPQADAPSYRPIGSFTKVGECFISHTLVRAMDNEEVMRRMSSRLSWAEIV